jgi:hypothetical protein
VAAEAKKTLASNTQANAAPQKQQAATAATTTKTTAKPQAAAGAKTAASSAAAEGQSKTASAAPKTLTAAASLKSCSEMNDGRLALTPEEESSAFAPAETANTSAEDAPMLAS